MLKDQRIWLLISLKLSGEASGEELDELESFLSTNQDLAEKVEMLQNIWKKSNETSTQQAENAFEKHFQRLNDKLLASFDLPVQNVEPASTADVSEQAGKKHYKLWWWVGAAASVLLFWFFFKNGENIDTKPVSNIVSAKPGFKTSINLPDGSKVWLNADSRITYDGDFQGDTREVHLSGEAFFDIAKDKTRPFIIHTKTINLKVLGTAFNVRSYDNDKETETSLVHGSVEVTLRNNPDKKIVLKPGEKLLVKNTLIDTLTKHPVSESNDEDEPIAVLTKMHYYGNDSSAVETSWTKNELVFNNERLDKIVLNLERWFKIKMTIKDETLKKGRFKITIKEEDKLEDVLEALRTAERLHYVIKNEEVVLNR